MTKAGRWGRTECVAGHSLSARLGRAPNAIVIVIVIVIVTYNIY